MAKENLVNHIGVITVGAFAGIGITRMITQKPLTKSQYINSILLGATATYLFAFYMDYKAWNQ